MRIVRALLLLAALLLPSVPVWAGEPPDRRTLAWEQAADRLIAAKQAGADAWALAVRETDVDAWLVADALVGRQAWDAAEALATASKGPKVDGLPAYVRAQRAAPADATLRDARDRAAILAGGGDFAGALAVIEGAHDVTDTVPGAALMSLRGAAAASLQRADEAVAAFRRAAEIAGRIGWIEHQHKALQKAGSIEFRASHAAAALELLRLQLPLAERVATPEDLAGCVINLGSACATLSRWDEAVAWLRRGLDLTLPGVGGDAKKRQNYRLNDLLALGQLHYHRGEYAHAVGILDEAPALAASLERPRERGLVLLFLAKSRLALELLEPAAAAYHEAGAVFEAQGDVARQREALLGEASCLVDVGDAAGALEIHDRVAGLAGANERTEAERIGDLGERALALQEAGRLDEAEAAYARALTLATRAGDEENATWIRIGQATLLCARRRFDQARPMLEDALAAARRMEHVYFERHARRWLAVVALAEGHPDVARAQVDQGLAQATMLLSGLSDTEAARARATLAELLAAGLTAAWTQGDAAGGLHYAEAGRGLGFLEMLGARAHEAVASIPADLKAAADAANGEVAAARRRLAELPADADRATARAVSRALDAALESLDQARRAIERTSKLAAAAAMPEPADAAQIAAALAPDEALIAFAATGGRVLAYVVRRDAAVRGVEIGAAQPLNEALESFWESARDPDAAVDTTALRDRLVRPLALGDDVRRVVVVPYGPLNEIPFGVLMPEREVAYAPSGTVLLHLGQPEAAPSAGVLALGDPDYTAAASRTSAARSRGGALVRLPATALEVKAIAAAQSDVMLLAGDATEEGLRRTLASRPRWHGVHFACHGLVDAERPALSSLALTPAGIDDGYLTALEVGSLTIPADLVVLSACETSRGRVEDAEGVLGLTRSFMLAGAPRVICSLWKVDDEATMALMVRFYELWRPPAASGRAPLPPARALREAQAFVRDHPDHPKWKHPYYWGAWVLWGVPR